jgi:hypothetical protein
MQQSRIMTLGLAVTALLALGGIARPGAAMASTAPGPANSLASCRGDNGPFLEVTGNLGTVFHATSGVYTVENKNAKEADLTVTNTVARTVSATVSASLSLSLDLIVEDTSAQLGISATVSKTTTIGVTGTIVDVPAHEYGNGQYGVFVARADVETYYLNDNCDKYDQKSAEVTMPHSEGWSLWISKSE